MRWFPKVLRLAEARSGARVCDPQHVRKQEMTSGNRSRRERLLGHGRPRSRLVKCKDVRLMAVAEPAAVRSFIRGHRAGEVVRSFTGFNLFSEVRDALQDSSRLINVIAHVFKQRRA